jgi:hypothetical protein
MAVVEAAAADHAAPPLQEEAPGAGAGAGADAGEREMRDLEDLLSKLNPMAEEFVPPSLASPAALTPAPLSPAAYGFYPAGAGFAVASPGHGGVVGFPAVADAHAARGRVRTLLQILACPPPPCGPARVGSVSDVSQLMIRSAAEEGRSRRRVQRPRSPRQEADQQPHQHGAARRDHPPHRLRLRHRSPGPRSISSSPPVSCRV